MKKHKIYLLLIVVLLLSTMLFAACNEEEKKLENERNLVKTRWATEQYDDPRRLSDAFILYKESTTKCWEMGLYDIDESVKQNESVKALLTSTSNPTVADWMYLTYNNDKEKTEQDKAELVDYIYHIYKLFNVDADIYKLNVNNRPFLFLCKKYTYNDFAEIIKPKLIAPNSLQIYGVKIWMTTEAVFDKTYFKSSDIQLQVDYGATNAYGGMLRKYCYMNVNLSNGKLSWSTYTDLRPNMVIDETLDLAT